MRAFFIVLAICSSTGLAEEWWLLPEPKFMAHQIVWPVPGSTSTVALPARPTPAGPEPLTPAIIAANTSLDRSALLAAARANAKNLLDRLTPILVRDSRGVILYALIASEDPLTASVVFAPDFATRFLETIGPDVLIAIPNRFRVYVFPRSAVPGPELSDRLFTDYGATNYPVSREVFEIRDGALKAVGALR